MSEMLGWGIVGTGDVSRAIVGDLQLVDSARCRAVSSRSADRARAFASEFGIDRSYGSIDALLADGDVQIVYIGTPHATHADITVRALEAGKHVLIEKPMAVDAVEVERIMRAARTSGRFVMEAMWMKFHPYFRAMLDDIRAGAIGEVRSVRASFGLPFAEPDSTRWSAARASSTLLDQGIYPVTLAVLALGEPTAIAATARTRSDGVDLALHATLDFEGHRYAQIAASMTDYVDPSASISGTAGWIEVPAPFWATDRYTIHNGAIPTALMQPTTHSFEREGRGYAPMLRAVSAAIADALLEHPLHDLTATLEVTRILDDIRTTATTELLETPR